MKKWLMGLSLGTLIALAGCSETATNENILGVAVVGYDDHIYEISDWSTSTESGALTLTLLDGSKMKMNNSVATIYEYPREKRKEVFDFLDHGREGTLTKKPISQGDYVVLGEEENEQHYAKSVTYHSSGYVSAKLANGIKVSTNDGILTSEFKNAKKRDQIVASFQAK